LSLVGFARIDSPSSIEQAILRSLDLIGYSFKKGSMNVIIKLNMCYYRDYFTGQTTDPKFVAALVSCSARKSHRARALDSSFDSESLEGARIT
jgi:uncharacterized protein (DUF362 family)